MDNIQQPLDPVEISESTHRVWWWIFAGVAGIVLWLGIAWTMAWFPFARTGNSTPLSEVQSTTTTQQQVVNSLTSATVATTTSKEQEKTLKSLSVTGGNNNDTSGVVNSATLNSLTAH